MAKGLPAGGRIIACDVSESWTSIAREHWTAAGVDDRIELRIGPAIETLRALPPDTVVDLAFIDADKTGYAAYYEELLARLAPDGVILVDNTLWSGRVLDEVDDSADTVALQVFNDALVTDTTGCARWCCVGDEPHDDPARLTDQAGALIRRAGARLGAGEDLGYRHGTAREVSGEMLGGERCR
ncbi:MAG: class I SAM-dependent methyltransferase [Ilumatobacteraceae bacterium]